VKPVSTKLEKLLREKLELLHRMESALSEQIAQLSENNLDDLSSRIDQNDEVMAAIKNIDYEIARIEASEGKDAAGISAIAGSLVAGIAELSSGNESKLVELIEKLSELKKKASAVPENNVKGRKIAGYKSSRDGRAINIGKKK
jgi:hypothetical protein